MSYCHSYLQFPILIKMRTNNHNQKSLVLKYAAFNNSQPRLGFTTFSRTTNSGLFPIIGLIVRLNALAFNLTVSCCNMPCRWVVCGYINSWISSTCHESRQGSTFQSLMRRKSVNLIWHFTRSCPLRILHDTCQLMTYHPV